MSEQDEIEAQSYKLILNSVCEHLSAMTDEIAGINSSLAELTELLRECTFAFNRGEARAIRTSVVD